METYISSKKQSWLSWFLRGVLILGFLILLSRLFELQIIKGDYYRGLSEGNRIRRVSIAAPRGKIYARGGELLADNINITKQVLFDPKSGFVKNQDFDSEEKGDLITESQRIYSLKNSGHLVGYLGEVDENEVGKIDPQCLEKGVRRLGALTGRGGLEEEYECTLRGIDGEQLVEVDTAGNKIRTLGQIKPIAGQDIRTNIDFGLQRTIAEKMGDEKGAVVATSSNGQVLAIYSGPSFNPNIFIKNSQEEIADLFSRSDLPLFDRSIGGRFHPGSVFKPLVSLAGLEEKAIEPDFLYDDTGEIVVKTPYGTFSYSNWYLTQRGGVEGKIDLVRAIARSTDTFFYKLGEFLGIDNIYKWSEKFGLNAEFGIDLPGEIAGLVPNPEWKMEEKGERWFLGNTYHIAIGQGDLALTPLGVNVITTTIANGGKICPPRLVGEPQCTDLDVKKENVDLVAEGMIQACSAGGTGFSFFDFIPQVACKTGTAEVGVDGKSHAWFTVFDPNDPEIVLTVLIEEGGSGSEIAGPIAKEIFDYYYQNKK